MKFLLRVLIVSWSLLFHAAAASVENTSVTQTKTRLKQLDSQINRLNQTLATANDKRGVLNQELAGTEKQMSAGIRKLRLLETGIAVRQQKITNLQQSVNTLNQQLSAQQQLLAHHIRTRYKMGEYQPIKWILNQDDPHAISRLMTFYQYLVHSRQLSMGEVQKTRNNLKLNQKNLKTEIAGQNNLQQQLHAQQKKLERNKRYHTAVINSLDQDIQTQQHSLSEVKRNKESLSQLLKTLALQSITQPSQAFVQMRHKLPRPITGITADALQKMNQGVTFFAAEGTPVKAVYPGRVVFSDWLNGYGLLLIIDHGKGFMTLYAHNQSLFKRKGTNVLQGEQIASVGHSGGIKQNGLYFEVRQGGKAVPPLAWVS